MRYLFWTAVDTVLNNNVLIGDLAEIGPGLQLVHPYSIVIGNAFLGRNCTIYQNVTIGANYEKDSQGYKYPSLGDNVRVSPGAVILGPVKIGSHVLIGANSVVLDDVPDNTVVAGAPAKIISKYDEARFG